jgi:hypothetical protein
MALDSFIGFGLDLVGCGKVVEKFVESDFRASLASSSADRPCLFPRGTVKIDRPSSAVKACGNPESSRGFPAKSLEDNNL